MSLRSLAEARIRRQRELTAGILDQSRQMWRQVDAGSIRASWLALVPGLFAVMSQAQSEAAAGASSYVTATLLEQGIDPSPVARLDVGSLSGVASDGRTLDTLLYEPAIAAVSAIGSGAAPAQALAAGQGLLETIVMTQLADAGRQAIAVDSAARRHVTGYVRMVVGATCGRCVVLAGRWYAYNEGFQRHPRCDCVHVPAREDTGRDIRTNPREFFNSLSKAEQDRQFTKHGAEAIRQGADISRVVNARRGAYGLSPASGRLTAAEREALLSGRLQTRNVFGRQLYTTSEATTKRGINRKVRLMPESIFAIANDREDALRLLRVHGYIL